MLFIYLMRPMAVLCYYFFVRTVGSAMFLLYLFLQMAVLCYVIYLFLQMAVLFYVTSLLRQMAVVIYYMLFTICYLLICSDR